MQCKIFVRKLCAHIFRWLVYRFIKLFGRQPSNMKKLWTINHSTCLCCFWFSVFRKLLNSRSKIYIQWYLAHIYSWWRWFSKVLNVQWQETFSRRIFTYLFLKGRFYRRGETENEVFHLLVYSPDDHNGQSWADEKPASSWSPTWMQGTKDLSHPPLLSHAINRKLDHKWSSQKLNQYLFGMLALQAEG